MFGFEQENQKRRTFFKHSKHSDEFNISLN